MCCIITDGNNKVVSISLIPGVEPIPQSYKVYFPWIGELPNMGDIITPPNSEDEERNDSGSVASKRGTANTPKGCHVNKTFESMCDKIEAESDC